MRPRHLLPAAAPVGPPCLPAHAGPAHGISRDVLAAADGRAAYAPRARGSAKPGGPQEEARQAERGSPRTESGGGCPADSLAPHNAYGYGGERDLTADAGWTPVPHGKAGSAAVVGRAVARGAGAGRIP
ncbi:hypothetical protein [Streptomyces nogalater]|uniref:Uncharacterized protein n=1 Tax=Streptomyces nogalater TaxID=38314 RepID=A0ABW0WQP7_STRNO